MNIESIRPYQDDEVREILLKYAQHPKLQALLDYAFPHKNNEYFVEVLSACHSIQDFHATIIYPALQRILDETTEGLTTSGFDELEKDKSYLYISNHRDIVLDTSLTNLVLLEKEMVMTSSAIGDNLVQEEFQLIFSKLNRNFLVERSLSPRDMLLSSKNLASYILHLIQNENRSVWLAQREGRTKDGNDKTNQGILKMLSMAKERGEEALEFLKKLRIVPLSISYEYDPTDYLKMPALLASYYEQEYVKTKDEDFNNIMTGVLGQKKRIHIAAGKVLDIELTNIAKNAQNTNLQLQEVAKCITERIHQLYRLWPTNYIAHDLLFESDEYQHKYTGAQKTTFQARVAKKTDAENPVIVKKFLSMYAYPVLNKYGSENLPGK